MLPASMATKPAIPDQEDFTILCFIYYQIQALIDARYFSSSWPCKSQISKLFSTIASVYPDTEEPWGIRIHGTGFNTILLTMMKKTSFRLAERKRETLLFFERNSLQSST